MATTYIIKKGTTYGGMNIEVIVNGSAVDLTDATITAEVVSDKSACGKHTYTIGKGIELTDPTNGIFTFLEDTIINWQDGKWYLIVTFTTTAYGTKKWIYKDYIFNVI